MLYEKCKYEFEQLKCTNGVENNRNADEKKKGKIKMILFKQKSPTKNTEYLYILFL